MFILMNIILVFLHVCYVVIVLETRQPSLYQARTKTVSAQVEPFNPGDIAITDGISCQSDQNLIF
jgi:hypothetical protein